MKTIDIAIKDLTRSMRSTFAVIFMFGVPLLVTGMFYFMFGNIASSDGSFDLPVTRVVIVNLDTGSPDLQMSASSMLGQPAAQSLDNLGEIIVSSLRSASFANLLTVTLATDSATARAAVDKNDADTAIIIPPDFSARFASRDTQSAQSVLELYANPEKTLELAVVQSILEQFMDGMSGAKIAASVAANHISGTNYTLIGQVVQKYLAVASQHNADSQTYFTLKSVAAIQTPNPMLTIIGPIMAGMMIFYAFYTGMTTAETILREDEEGTLPRLFTTPTAHTTILTGKFLAVGLTVLVQVVVLIIASRFIFRIQWGNPFYVVLITLGTVLAASSFGIFANSLIKSSKQGGVIYGGLLTVTGMLGMIKIFTLSVPNVSPKMEIVSLLVPQGWAIRGFLLNSASAPFSDLLFSFTVLILWSIVFFSIGAWRFHRRFA
jgi:ABC-2 type transport system permease protein